MIWLKSIRIEFFPWKDKICELTYSEKMRRNFFKSSDAGSQPVNEGLN